MLDNEFIPATRDGLTPPQRARNRYISRANIPGLPVEQPLTAYAATVQTACGLFIKDCLDGGGPMAGVGLCLWGPYGTGKTSLAKSILRTVISEAPREWLGKSEYDALRPGYFTTQLNLIDLHHESWRDDEYSDHARSILRGLYYRSPYQWENTRVLVLDDVGKENPLVGTGHKSQVVYDLIRARYSHGAPTIITANYHPTEWRENYGPATASFLHEGFIPVEVGGKDHRLG